MTKKTIQIYPMNRIEGDIKIKLEVEHHVVTDVWSSGIMYRGFENILVGRGHLDGLVITPRICGICSTSHLYSAAKALDMISAASLPDDAIRIRNITLMVEMIQSDIRHAFLIYMTDFCRPAYKQHSLYEESLHRYEPMAGSFYKHVVRVTKKILEIVAILGGQWPHSSFMVPGGVVSLPNQNEITQCMYLLRDFRDWYEKQVLGCSIERWMDVKSRSDLLAWLEESEHHQEKELGFFIRFSQEAGLEEIGKGHGNYISFGALDMPRKTAVQPIGNQETLLPAGFVKRQGLMEPFSEQKITEDTSHAWFSNGSKGVHPFAGDTAPYATGNEGARYSWIKAPRYEGKPAETGPLAEMMVSRNPLFVDLVKEKGPSAFNRQLARILRPALLLPVLEKWLGEISCARKHFFDNYNPIENGQGFGLIEAPRGALGHWVKIKNGRIEKYQIITPSVWNGSPRDRMSVKGPWEEALMGTEIKDIENPIEVDHVIRSFDPCMVCAVHVIDRQIADD
ncbi:MAG: nickel-dependent hydrogenase large subunit [Pseudomonadota bacterium]